MFTKALPLVILCFLQACLAISNQQSKVVRPMELWKDPNNPDDENANKRWLNEPTWHATLFWDTQALLGRPSYEALLTLANEFFNWVVQQKGARSNDENIVIAVLYNPANSYVEASTVPRGPRLAQMIDERNKAPLWSATAANYISVVHPPLCAEDGTEFSLETAQNNGIVGPRYPHGTQLAVWASFKEIDGIGREYYPCSRKRGTEIDGCLVTARRLGIGCLTFDQYLNNPTFPNDGPLPPIQGPRPENSIPQEQPEDSYDTLPFHSDEFPNDYDPRNDVRGLQHKQRIAQGEIERNDGNTLETPRKLVARSQPLNLSSVSGIYVSTTWPIYTNIQPFPTPQNVITLSDPAFRSLVATGPITAVVSTTSTTSATSATSAIPSVSCYMQQEDPDSGITSAFCVCQSSKTLPLLTLPAATVATQSCEYTSLPSKGAQITPTTTLGPKTTHSKICSVCSLAENNENACASIPSCFPSTVKVSATAGSSPVHVGTLTGDQLYTSVSNALTSLCPTVSQTQSSTSCQGTAPVQIKGIDYINDEDEVSRDGVLEVQVDISSYNDTQIRGAMIETVARSVQVAATSQNCAVVKYIAETPGRRWSFDDYSPRGSPALTPRIAEPILENLNATFCTAFQFYAVNFYNPWYDLDDQTSLGSSHLFASLSFEVEQESNIFCEVMEAVTPFLAVIEPEFVPEEFAMEGDIEFNCDLGDITMSWGGSPQ